ncbi:MAG: protein-glutamate O-methyltransferase CheR [Deltaproteobacteria bacterium]|nr:protein-glutamate O-methyltransferase CheR [Deltaproteobacteria bacterium]
MNLDNIELPLLLEAIYQRYRYDFRSYSDASLKRRLHLALNQLQCESISILQDRVLRDPEFFLKLLQYMTVSTSEMFRDPLYFSELRQSVIPTLRTFPSLKIWIAGCSTGEEVYSLSILLAEEELLERSLIYATDINPSSLEKAEKGIYSAEFIPEMTKNYGLGGGKQKLSDYYEKRNDKIIFDPELRSNVLFADHSLTTDFTFSEVHFVSCRNVMIYFDKIFQDRTIDLFFESLVYQGFLGLGAKESLRFSNHESDFQVVSSEAKIYQKKFEVAQRRNVL